MIRRRQWHPTPVLLPGKSHGWRSLEGCSPWGRWGSDVTEWLHFHFHFPALEKEMAAHSSVLPWRIPGMGEPGGLLSMGSHRVGHDWSILAAAAAWHCVRCMIDVIFVCLKVLTTNTCLCEEMQPSCEWPAQVHRQSSRGAGPEIWTQICLNF